MKDCPSLRRFGAFAASAFALLFVSPAWAQLAQLGTAGYYAVLGGSSVTSTGGTVLTGSLGVSPSSAITGFAVIDGGPGQFTGALNQGNVTAAQAQADSTAAYLSFAGMPFTSDLSGMDLGGLTLTPGVYYFSSSAQLTGALTLDAQSDASARFIFQIGSTLTTASNSVVNLINLGEACGPDAGLFWQVGSSATLGVNSDFAGSILALTSITLNSGASIAHGRALAQNGAVTLDGNRIDASDPTGGYCVDDGSVLTPVPEASTYGIFATCALFVAVWRRHAVGAGRLERRHTPPARV